MCVSKYMSVCMHLNVHTQVSKGYAIHKAKNTCHAFSRKRILEHLISLCISIGESRR